MRLPLEVLYSLSWIVAYAECIRIGFGYKTYAMPAFGLGLNISWELIYSVAGLSRFYQNKILVSSIIAWFLLDIAIAFTYFRYGYKYRPKWCSQSYFFAWSILMFFVCFVLQVLFLNEFGTDQGARYSAFLSNLLMSVLFIDMFSRRKGGEGQSLVIAVSKLIGTLSAIILYGFIERNYFILVVGLLCGVYDSIYTGLLFFEKNKQAIRENLEVSGPEFGGTHALDGAEHQPGTAGVGQTG